MAEKFGRQAQECKNKLFSHPLQREIKKIIWA